MGAPKQKWTSEEEAALKAGIQKYGVGKWSTILKDPEFNVILRSRSNVDLKDKWRNLNCMASGLGSRHRASVSHKNSQLAPKLDEDAAVHGLEAENDSMIVASHDTTSNEANKDHGHGKQIIRLDDVIMEAISKLKEPRGSSRHTINEYIEEHYSAAPPDFERILATRLKILTDKGQLIKVKHQYRIGPMSIIFDASRELPSFHSSETNIKDASQVHNTGVVILTKEQVDAELENMKYMNAEEAAAAAALAVAEAEAAIEAAEAAAKEAEEAEAEAEAARCFANATKKALYSNNTRFW